MNPKSGRYEDWGDAPDIPTFYGRSVELASLRQWVVEDHCKIVAILGIAGIGKTDLSVELGRGETKHTDLPPEANRGISQSFTFTIWRKLINAPSISDTLLELVKFLSLQKGRYLIRTCQYHSIYSL